MLIAPILAVAGEFGSVQHLPLHTPTPSTTVAQWRLALPCWARHNVWSDHRRTGRRVQLAAASAAPRLRLPSGAPVACGAAQRVCVGVCAAQSPMIHDSPTRTWVLRVLRGPAPPCAGGRAKRPPAAFARVLYHRAISIYLSPPEPGPHPGCFAIEPYHDRAERSPCAARRQVSMSCPVSTRPCLVIVITPFDSRFSMLDARTTRQLATYATCTSPHARTGRRRHVDGRTTTTTLSSNPPAAA